MLNNKKYICIDLDGTVAHYTEWRGDEFFGDPIEGVQAALKQLKNEGWEIIIYTTRNNRQLIEGYLNRNSIPFDHVNHNPDQPPTAIGGKPYAEAYIDDRGIQFNGNWAATLNEVRRFVPWEMRTASNLENEDRKPA